MYIVYLWVGLSSCSCFRCRVLLRWVFPQVRGAADFVRPLLLWDRIPLLQKPCPRCLSLVHVYFTRLLESAFTNIPTSDPTCILTMKDLPSCPDALE